MLSTLRKSEVLISISIIATALFLSFAFFITPNVSAQSPHDNIVFPIPELGGCESEEECKAYCDSLLHINKCVDFAEANGLMSAGDARIARNFARSGGEGPGGCSDRRSCDAFCEDINNIEECLAFAEEHDILRGEELAEARKIAKALREGAQLPGGCQSRDECELYCENPNNIDECLAFAEKAGFLPPEELARARKFHELLRRGETPGGCRGERECRAYCEQGNNFEECSEFAINSGFVTPAEAELIRRTGGRGPGDCRSREGCDAFCSDPANSQTCFEFAREHGLIGEEEFQQAQEGMNRLKNVLNDAPPAVIACLNDGLGAGFVEGVLSGGIVPSHDVAEVVEKCFREAFSSDEFRDFGHDGDFDEGEGFRPPERFNEDSASRGGPEDAFDGFLNNFLGDAPQRVRDCFHSRGADDIGRVASGEADGTILRPVLERCFRDFGQSQGFDEPNNEGATDIRSFDRDIRRDEGFSAPPPPSIDTSSLLPDFPPAVYVCIENRLGRDFAIRVSSGELSPTRVIEVARVCSVEIKARLLESQDGSVPPPTIDFPSPSDFSPENLDQQGASLLPFIIHWQ